MGGDEDSSEEDVVVDVELGVEVDEAVDEAVDESDTEVVLAFTVVDVTRGFLPVEGLGEVVVLRVELIVGF